MNSDEYSEHNFDDELEPPSKSQRKREMHALQAMGVQLTQLSSDLLAQMPLTPELEKAIPETKNIKKNEALRRHHQYLGKLMRKADHITIAKKLASLKAEHNRLTALARKAEQWRDELVAGDEADVQRFIDQFPQVDRQHLRHIVRKAKEEAKAQKPPASARKLFRIIRDQVVQP